MAKMKSYNELVRLPTFEERYDYLRVHGQVGQETFGFDRYMNQQFYTSSEWRHIRNLVIARDLGCDLGIKGYEIYDKVIIHHMNPLTEDDIQHSSDNLMDLDSLITTSHRTHNAIHYGDRSLLAQPLVERHPGDTLLW